jgi:hypothetical protein
MEKLNIIRVMVAGALVLLVFGCSKDEEENPYASGPQIEWVSSGTIMTYNYSGGVLSGVNLHLKFNVVDKSGDVQILVKNKDSNGDIIDTKTLVENVESGSQYKITVACGLADKSSSCSIIYDSPTAQSPFSYYIKDYALNINSVVVSLISSD